MSVCACVHPSGVISQVPRPIFFKLGKVMKYRWGLCAHETYFRSVPKYGNYGCFTSIFFLIEPFLRYIHVHVYSLLLEIPTDLIMRGI